MKPEAQCEKNLFVKLILTIQGIILILFLCMFFWPDFEDIIPMPYIMFGGGGLLTLSGIILLYIISKQDFGKVVEKYLKMAGGGAIGLLTFAVIHNLFYALAEYFSDLTVIKYLADILGALSFLIATIISPVLLIIGIIGGAIKLRSYEKKGTL